jgi:hypothetical protein
MKYLEEQYMCVCVKFCYKLGKNFAGTLQSFKQAHREECMSRAQCYEWFKHFKEGRMRLVKIPGLYDLPHQQLMTMLRKFKL